MKEAKKPNEQARWCLCPVCRRKLARMEKNAAVKGIYVWCDRCKKERELRA